MENKKRNKKNVPIRGIFTKNKSINLTDAIDNYLSNKGFIKQPQTNIWINDDYYEFFLRKVSFVICLDGDRSNIIIEDIYAVIKLSNNDGNFDITHVKIGVIGDLKSLIDFLITKFSLKLRFLNYFDY